MDSNLHSDNSHAVVCHRFSDYLQLESSLHDADIHMCLLAKPNMNWLILHASLSNASLQFGHDAAANYSLGSVKPSVTGFMAPLDYDTPQLLNGHLLQNPGEFLFYRPGAEFSARSGGPTRWVSFAVQPEHLNLCLAALSGHDPLSTPHTATHIIPEQPQADTLHSTLQHAASVALNNPEALATTDARHGLEQSLLTAFVRALESSPYPKCPHNRARLSRRRIIQTVEEFLQANPDKPIYLVDLCTATQMSERSLHDAFVYSFGLSPLRYLKLRRLNQVRRALLQADPRRDSVTHIAAQFGVWEMGRFAGEYRNLFGEYPSQTLSGSHAKPPSPTPLQPSA